VDAGLESYEALAAATRRGGELLGEADAGVVREGGPADFFLAYGDPLSDPSALWRVWRAAWGIVEAEIAGILNVTRQRASTPLAAPGFPTTGRAQGSEPPVGSVRGRDVGEGMASREAVAIADREPPERGLRTPTAAPKARSSVSSFGRIERHRSLDPVGREAPRCARALVASPGRGGTYARVFPCAPVCNERPGV
jgi:hypothetical protein